MRKNWFLTFCTACVPGCGQMYLGYMRRGFSLALWFWGIVMLALVFNLGFVTMLLPVIWAYAFFDSFNIRNLAPEQRAGFADDFIPTSAWMSQHNIGDLVNWKGGRVLGWGLVILGGAIIYNTVLRYMLWGVWDMFPILRPVVENLFSLCVAAVVIVLGWRILRGKKTPPDDDFVQYNGGDGHA